MNKYELNILNKCDVGTYFITPYTTAKTSVILSCSYGHHRVIIPSNLVSRGTGSECKECQGLRSGKKTTEDFSEELSIKYPELKLVSEYIGAKTPVTISCESGHTWKAIPSNLLSRESDAVCKVCIPRSSHNLLSIEEVNSRVAIHYPYLKIITYNTSHEHSEVLDTRCGLLSKVLTGNIIRGLAYKCEHCEPHLVGTSAMEQNLIRFIKDNYSGWLIESDNTMLYPKELDVVLPDLGIAIEFDGTYFHSEEKCGKAYHLNKTKGVEAYDYRLIHIYDNEWVNKRKIVESRLLNILGKSTKIYARKCSISKISFPREFLNTNHIQGAGAASSVNYGLFLDTICVAVMTFSKPKFTTDVDYELVRYCSILNHSVVGGASKLLARFRKEYASASILSYSDKRWSTGNLYKKLNFSYSHTSIPGYRWYKGLNYLSRYKCQKGKLEALFPQHYKEELSETDIMKLAGYHRVFDCGNDVWVLK